MKMSLHGINVVYLDLGVVVVEVWLVPLRLKGGLSQLVQLLGFIASCECVRGGGRGGGGEGRGKKGDIEYWQKDY